MKIKLDHKELLLVFIVKRPGLVEVRASESPQEAA